MIVPSLAPLTTDTCNAQPAVSIVIPTYRRAQFVASTIRTILAQSFSDYEVIVQDDASPDGTSAVIKEIGDSRVRYERNSTNLGMPGNLNEGIRRTRGRYVMVCHDHDLYHPELISQMVRLLSEQPNVAYVHTGVAIVDAEGRTTGKAFVGKYAAVTPGKEWARYMLGRFDSPVCANSMVPRHVYEKTGLYNPNWGFIADVEMWLRLAMEGDVGYISAPLIEVRERETEHVIADIHWDVIENLIAIHKLYQPRVLSGWDRARHALGLYIRTERHLLRNYTHSVAKRQWDDAKRGRSAMRRSNTVFSKALSYLGRS